MDGFAPYLGPAVGIMLSSAMSSNTSSSADIAQSLVERVPGFSDAQALIKKATGLDVLYLALGVLLFDGARRVLMYLYKTVDKLLVSWFTSDILIDANDEIRDEILAWFAARYSPRFGARSLMIYSGAAKQKRLRHPYLEHRMKQVDDREAEINFTPSLGRHYFFPLGWRLFIFEREGKEQTRGWNQQASQDITIRCLGWSDTPLKEFILLCKAFKKEKSKGRTMTYTYSNGRSGYSEDGGNWGAPYAAPSRDLSTVELDTDIKNDIVKDITRYLEPKTAEFYKNNGIPYRRGFLLHGPPGTGKSSLSKALASHFNLALYCMNLGEEGIGDRDLRSAFAALPTKCIVLLEDIDSSGIGREKPVESQEEKDALQAAKLAGVLPSGLSEDDFSGFRPRDRSMTKITLSGLLNALDGASASEGRIVIMTSNHPDVLDSALIRPGRVDKRILLPDMSRASAKKIFSRMYSNTGVQGLAGLAEAFSSRLPEGKITPAELQGFILDHMDQPNQAVDEIGEWADRVVKEKESEQERREARSRAREVARAFRKSKQGNGEAQAGADKSEPVINGVESDHTSNDEPSATGGRAEAVDEDVGRKKGKGAYRRSKLGGRGRVVNGYTNGWQSDH